MNKKILLFVLTFVALLSSTFAHPNAEFNLTPQEFVNTTSNQVDVNYKVQTAGANLITATSFLILKTDTKGDIILDTLQTAGLSDGQDVNHTFNLNYNGNYIVKVDLFNEDNISQEEINTDVTFSVLGLLTHPFNYNSEGFNDIGQLSLDSFDVLGSLLEGVTTLLTGDLLLLAVVSTIIIFLTSVILLILKLTKNSIKTSTRQNK